MFPSTPLMVTVLPADAFTISVVFSASEKILILCEFAFVSNAAPASILLPSALDVTPVIYASLDATAITHALSFL